MPNTFTENRDRWLQMSEIDYLGQFVKVWLAFNAWYRGAYTETWDRKIIDEIKWTPNPIAARYRPLLEHTSEEAEQFRGEIGLLHHRLERYELHHGKGIEKTRIRLSNIVIRTEPPAVEEIAYRSWKCAVERIANGNVTVVITSPDGMTKVNLAAHKYDPAQLDGDVAFGTLSDNLQARCRSCYRNVNPYNARDLTAGDAELIICGTHQFRCGPEFLFAGVVEAIYLMRCSLFHGELNPTREASECYEPCYRILRRFLESVV
jgi:hypothetical protein